MVFRAELSGEKSLFKHEHSIVLCLFERKSKQIQRCGTQETERYKGADYQVRDAFTKETTHGLCVFPSTTIPRVENTSIRCWRIN